jgi:hypothetical protein
MGVALRFWKSKELMQTLCLLIIYVAIIVKVCEYVVVSDEANVQCLTLKLWIQAKKISHHVLNRLIG